LLRYAGRFEPWQRKVKTLEELVSMVDAFRRRGLRIVFTNGCFDLLHAGHIQLLQAARRLGDVLIVGLNSDESVRALKGEGRPVIPEKERLQILASLDCVAYLVVFSEPTPTRIIETLRPDILAKGANYAQDEVTGHEIVERYGGRIERVPIRSEISVSRLVNRIVQQFGREGETS
jgi:D-beta-D-heptose 7-phosphate kinase/D-beta-D-heptose 1-phosphate adenosyltransferase